MNGAYLDGSVRWPGFNADGMEVCWGGSPASGFWWLYISD